MTDPMVTFYLARLDEDYAAAKAAYDEASDFQLVGSTLAEEHFLGWKPDRVMRDIEAKRRIVELYERAVYESRQYGPPDEVASLYEVICHLVTEFDQHEDYDESWRP